uniref:THAP-type domain-containing protein n=2 Tax=Homalodisca liturata TaxID=320908 RepID=A0A1B6HTM4_9HEMI
MTERLNSRRYCSYKGCSSDRLLTKNGAISFFSFPIKDTERCSMWISKSGREEFRYLTPKELGEKKICELHFDHAMFSNDLKTNLTKRAFPLDWRVSSRSPELIQIDDDENSIECENFVLRESPVTTSTNGPISNGVSENENNTNVVNTNGSILNAVLSSGASPKSVQSSKQITVATNTVEGNHGNTTLDKSTAIPASLTNKNTKFHNLPPQSAPPTDFYYQQCPSVEETNHSFPEPPDGELPLFVQQSSVVSLAEDPEPAHSEVSEPQPKRRRRDRGDDDLADQMRDAMKHLKNITSLLTSSEDEFELFGRSVALQLKKMSLCTALTVQAKIQHLLSQYRISDIKREAKDRLRQATTNEADSEENKCEDKVKGGEEHPEASSPQLSLTCASETSDNEATEVG